MMGIAGPVQECLPCERSESFEWPSSREKARSVETWCEITTVERGHKTFGHVRSGHFFGSLSKVVGHRAQSSRRSSQRLAKDDVGSSHAAVALSRGFTSALYRRTRFKTPALPSQRLLIENRWALLTADRRPNFHHRRTVARIRGRGEGHRAPMFHVKQHSVSCEGRTPSRTERPHNP